MLSRKNIKYRKVREVEDRLETLEEIIENTELLITETNMVEERLFYSCAITDNLLRNFNVICHQVNASVASEVIRHNNVVIKELKLRRMTTIGTLESTRTTLLMRMKHERQLRHLKK